MIDRRRSNSMKWACAHALLSPDEAAADPLPMWVPPRDGPRLVQDTTSRNASLRYLFIALHNKRYTYW
ncbi:hypothetical protein ACWDRB_54725 [Nonomuraea sp. NPDC003707]